MRRVLAGRAILIMGGTATGLLLMELVLRVCGISSPVFLRPDPHCGYVHRESAEGYYSGETRTYIRINSDGLRDREHERRKPARALRIVVLGDSYAEAFQVPMEQTFWWVLQAELSRDPQLEGRQLEVINFGVGGYGTAQELMTLRHRAWNYSPDLVLLAFLTGNDVRNNSRILNRDDRMPYFVHQGKALVLDDTFLDWYRSRQGPLAHLYYAILEHSNLLQVFKAARFTLERMEWMHERRGLAQSAGLGEVGLDVVVYVEPKDTTWKEAWSVTEDLLTTMNREVRGKGATFMVVTLSNGDQVDPDVEWRHGLEKQLEVPDLFYPERRIRSLGEREGFSVLNLAPVLQNYAEESGHYLHGFRHHLGTGHWNAEGHHLAGHLIAEALTPWLHQVLAVETPGPSR